MNSLNISPEVVTLIQGFKPFLGNFGIFIADVILKIIDFVTSDTGNELITALNKVTSLGKSRGQSITLSSALGPLKIDVNFSFIIFLILILLVFSNESVHSNTKTSRGRLTVAAHEF